MFKRFAGFQIALLCLLLLVTAKPTPAQNPFGGGTAKGKNAEEPLPEFALTEADLDALQGQTFDVVLKNGKKETGLTLKELQRHKQQKNQIRSIDMTQTTPKKNRKFPPSQVLQLETEGQKYEVKAIANQKSFVLVDTTKRLEAVKAELESQERQLWPDLTTEEREKYVTEDKEFLDKIKSEFPDIRWNLVETENFLFLSELPANQVTGIIKQLDRVSEAMAKVLDAPTSAGIWRGKCPIVAFTTRSAFQKFEQLLPPQDFPDMAEPASPSNQRAAIVRMYKDGRVLIGGQLESGPDQFGVALVRAVARGYLHRHRSNVPMPFWIREGIADWMTGVVLPGNKPLQSIQQAAVNELKQSGSLGETFFITDTMEVWECGVASGMIQMMAEGSPAKFQQYINGMKEGKGWQDFLQETYGLQLKDLVTGYGRAIGIPNLKEVED